ELFWFVDQAAAGEGDARGARNDIGKSFHTGTRACHSTDAVNQSTDFARLLDRQDGPTALAGQSFSGMIVTGAGVRPTISAVVYVAARAPDAEEDYTALASKFPTPPATAGIVFDEGRLNEAAFLHDFAGDLPEARARVLYAVQQPFHKALLTGK